MTLGYLAFDDFVRMMGLVQDRERDYETGFDPAPREQGLREAFEFLQHLTHVGAEGMDVITQVRTKPGRVV